MDLPNKGANASVDDILNEVLHKGPAPGVPSSSLDDILAELGLDAPKMPQPQAGQAPAAVPPAAAAQARPSVAQGQPAAAQGQARQTPDAQSRPAGQTQPIPAQRQAEPRQNTMRQTFIPGGTQQIPAQRITADRTQNITATLGGTRRLPIWGDDAAPEPIAPRMGKAAALEKVETDKFVGDEQLTRWFSDTDMHTSKRDQKKAERERRKQLAAEDKDERRREKNLRKGVEEEPVFEEISPAVPQGLPGAPFAASEAAPQATQAFGTRQDTAQGGTAQRPQAGQARQIPAQQAQPATAAQPYHADAHPQADFSGIAPAPPQAQAAISPKRPAIEQAAAQTTQTVPSAGEEELFSPARVARAEQTQRAKGVTGTIPLPTTDELARQAEAQAARRAAIARQAAAQQTQQTQQIPAQRQAQPAATRQMPPVSARQQARPGAASPGGATRPVDTRQFAAQQPSPARHAAEAAAQTAVFKPISAVTKSNDTAEVPALAHSPAQNAPAQTAETQVFMAAAPGAGEAPGIPVNDGRTQGEKDAWLPSGAAEHEDDPAFAAAVSDARERAAGQAEQKKQKRDTLQYDLDGTGEDGRKRVPTAAYTQEFDNADPAAKQPPADDRSLFLDDMVDDRFRAFFEDTVIVEREDYSDAARAARARRKARRSRTSLTGSLGLGGTGAGTTTRSSLITGEFTRMGEQVEGEEAEEDFGDYTRPQDAEAVAKDIAAMRTGFTRRAAISGVLALLLAWLSFGMLEKVPIPAFLNPSQNPVAFGVVYLVLLVAAIAINLPTISSGLLGLFEEPVVDTSVALAAVVSALQGIAMLIYLILEKPLTVTPFGAIATLLLAANAFGKRLRTTSILENFHLASAGIDHSAAYVLDGGHELAFNITKGLEEENPTLLISRPTALVKGFLRQSFSMRKSDVWGRYIGWGLAATGLIAGIITFALTKDLVTAVSAFAGLLAIGAPLSSTLVSAIPSLLLQQGASKVGAVVPGWSAIEELGYVNVVMAGAKDVFPPNAVTLKGIKTFEKVRVDLAILYAASVLIEGCETLRGIFQGIIQNRSDMLYKVENLLVEQGRGFTAWVQNSRLVIGTREMMQKHDIDPPPVELEMKYTKPGHVPVYLAVSGRLFAMFIVQYAPEASVQVTLDGLIKSGVSLLVTSDDPNITSGLIEQVYQLPEGVVKVLGRRELELLEPLRTYLPESDGVMTHIGTFTSFIGGMRAAAGCAASENMSSIIQLAAVGLACLLSLLLAFSGGLANLALGIVFLFQLGWTVLISAMPFARRY